GDLAQEVEPAFGTEVRARLDEAGRIDDERGLAERLLRLDHSRHACIGAHYATPRIRYAGGTSPPSFSWSGHMPSMRASGRGGQPGTWMSTGTILSTPCSTV